MTVFWRYWLLQVPGWGVLLVILFVAHRWFELRPAVGVAVFAAWILKDVAIYPLLKSAYELREVSPADSLIGARGEVLQALDPRGYVRVRGELWAAEARPVPGARRAESIPEGAGVVVEFVEGLTLRVRRAEGPPPGNRG